MAKERITITPFGRTRLNNSEYSNFMNEVRKLADVAGYEKLGLDQTELADFDSKVQQLVQIGLQTAAKSQTLTLTELDYQRGTLETFIFMTARYAQDLPIDNLATAAKNLYINLKPYVGMQDAALTQESAQVNSLLIMLILKRLFSNTSKNTFLSVYLSLNSAASPFSAKHMEDSVYS